MENEAKRKSRLWLAMLPGILITAGVGTWSVQKGREMRQVADLVAPGGASAPRRLDCVEPYAITLKNSEFYVPEPGAFTKPKPKYAPREISTVLQGMVRNGCDTDLKQVRLRINVKDGEGKRGSAWAETGPIPRGQVKAFERAWMGRVTSYEIVEIR